jgi:hypothetical protein
VLDALHCAYALQKTGKQLMQCKIYTAIPHALPAQQHQHPQQQDADAAARSRHAKYR